MNRCPITYEICHDQKYSLKGLRLFSPKLKTLKDFPFSEKEQIELALRMATKISIQGVQPKLSVKLNVSKGEFEIVESGGTYILKPQHQIYEDLPQNEDVTMRMAQKVGIEVPFHGMIYNNENALTYCIRRFDRLPKGHKLAVEDFSQILGYSRETKYESTMEKIVSVLENHCTFPLLEKIKLFKLALFNFLVGNEDAHLKNFSLIRREGKVELSPAYDLINSSIVVQSGEELALPLRGKKSKIKRSDLVEYYGKERLGLSDSIIEKEMMTFEKVFPAWRELLTISFLSDKMKKLYLELLEERHRRVILS